MISSKKTTELLLEVTYNYILDRKKAFEKHSIYVQS